MMKFINSFFLSFSHSKEFLDNDKTRKDLLYFYDIVVSYINKVSNACTYTKMTKL